MATDSTVDTGCDSMPSSMTDASPDNLPTSPMRSVPPSPLPPPPMPYPFQENTSKIALESKTTSIMVQKFKSAPPNWLTTGYTLDDPHSPEPREFRKVHYFFYGTLQDPRTLSHVLETTIDPSSLRPASIIGYSCELWGSYKALVDGPTGAIVEGLAYEVQCEEEEARLAAYETNAYETVSCRIDFNVEGKGSTPQTTLGKTFRYAGDPEALRERRFDRKLWVRNMAPKLGF